MIAVAAVDLFIVDDHALVRDMLAEYLSMEPDLRVVGTAASGAEALARIPESGCAVALVDVAMPGMSGIELVRRLKREQPDVACLMFSGHVEQVYVRDALEAGASGYVMKGDPAVIAEAVRQVLQGGVYLSERVKAALEGPKG